jgi:hypothetical protein
MKGRPYAALGIVISACLAAATTASADHPPVILIDEDCMDNSSPAILELASEGACGGGDPAVCVNDHIADPGVRDPLNIPEGTIIGNGVSGGTDAPLLTGQITDEGLFRLTVIPQSWVDAGPTSYGDTNYLLALSAGFGHNGEFLLDNIPGVTPQRTAELEALVGQTFCGVVYDSDISIDYQTFEGNLQGANYGVLSFTLLDVGEDPPGSVLPDITIRVEDPDLCTIGPVGTEPASWGQIKSIYR